MEVLLRYHHIPEIDRIDVYQRNGGYHALTKAAQMRPDEIVRAVEEAGLRGRGGAGFSTATKWTAVLNRAQQPHYFICNIAEGEPGSFKDRELLKNPHMVLEATAISAHAIGAEKAFIYLRGSFQQEEQLLKTALLQARNQKLIGTGSKFPSEIVIHRGEDSYIAGEETAMIESLEGKRAIPRTKPPRPYEYGLWESPTCVNNIETICNVIPILLSGPHEFRSYGTEQSPGTKLFCLSGQIRKPGLYEQPLGIPLNTLLHELGGGPFPGRRFVAVFPGGYSTPIVRVEQNPKLDFEGLKEAGSALGTGGMIVLDDSSDMRKVAVEVARFFAVESCQACPPCSYGTAETYRLFQELQNGGGNSAGAVLKIREFCEMMKFRGQCGHNRAAAMTHLSILNHFPEVFQ